MKTPLHAIDQGVHVPLPRVSQYQHGCSLRYKCVTQYTDCSNLVVKGGRVITLFAERADVRLNFFSVPWFITDVQISALKGGNHWK